VLCYLFLVIPASRDKDEERLIKTSNLIKQKWEISQQKKSSDCQGSGIKTCKNNYFLILTQNKVAVLVLVVGYDIY
jgi:hypothetical protein